MGAERSRKPRMVVTSELIANPYPTYAALRDHSPIPDLYDYPPGTVPGQDEPVRAWALLRHREVYAAARDAATFSSRDPLQEASAAPTLMVVNHDDPEHARLRGLVNKAFSPRRIRALGPWIGSIADSLLERVADREIEFVDEVASVIPTRVMVHLFGLPEGDAPSFLRWANAFMLSADLTPEERNTSNVEMIQYFQTHVAERAKSIRGDAESARDLMDALLLAEVDGERLTMEEVVRFCFTLMVAGSETTTIFITNLFDMWLDRPDLYETVRRDRTLVSAFVEETLRLTGPPQRLFRVATRDVEVGHEQIRKGDWVALFFAAANRDPEVFPDPDTFRLDRPNAREHLTFGVGIHFCLGAALARLEADRILNAALDRFPRLSRGAGPRVSQTANFLTHGCSRLPIVMHA